MRFDAQTLRYCAASSNPFPTSLIPYDFVVSQPYLVIRVCINVFVSCIETPSLRFLPGFKKLMITAYSELQGRCKGRCRRWHQLKHRGRRGLIPSHL